MATFKVTVHTCDTIVVLAKGKDTAAAQRKALDALTSRKRQKQHMEVLACEKVL